MRSWPIKRDHGARVCARMCSYVCSYVCVCRACLSVPCRGWGQVEDYWGPSKRILGNAHFLDMLRNFAKDDVPAKVMNEIRTRFLPREDFVPEAVRKASSAAMGTRHAQ